MDWGSAKCTFAICGQRQTVLVYIYNVQWCSVEIKITSMVCQHSKLTFSKGCLLATFNCKMVAILKIFSRQKERKRKGEDTSWHITRRQKGEDTSYIVHEGLIRRTAGFSTLYFCYSKFTHSCRVSELREVKREMQVMPPLDDNFSRKFLF